MQQSVEKSGNTWWVKCTCDIWFPASEDIVRNPSVKMLCPNCKRTFFAADAGDLLDPSSRRVKL